MDRQYRAQSPWPIENLGDDDIALGPHFEINSVTYFDFENLHETGFNLKPIFYTLSEAWSGVNRADLMAAQGAFGTDFYARSILCPKHRAYYRSNRPLIKIGPKGALGSHEIRPIQSAPSLGQSIVQSTTRYEVNKNEVSTKAESV